MSTNVQTRMDSDSFIAWAMEQPDGGHYELHDGEVVLMPNVRHYLIVDPATRRVIRHTRTADGVVTAHIHGDEPVPLDPPGIVLADIFPAPVVPAPVYPAPVPPG